jgi:endonuclease G
MNTELMFFNGINGDNGEYDLPPMTGDDLAEFIKGESPPENLGELRHRYRMATERHLGVKEGVDPKDLGQAGWGVVFAFDDPKVPAVKEALAELLDLRREQAGDHFRIYEGGEGCRPNEAKSKFLARHGAGPGPANPDKVPYYLLIVGDPETIPYRFQTQLDVQYAVGRVHFDTLDEYASYARSVVEAETGSVKLPRRAAFFGVANPDDRATQMSADELIDPLQRKFQADQPDWQIDAFLRSDATKGQLGHLLGGDQTPALLFTAGHGMSFSLGSDRQLPHQGALLCQDWPGPTQWRGSIPQDFYMAGDDLADDARLLGLIGFFFACYGAGTPLLDEFSKQAFKDRTAIAPRPFLARLPTRMLGHPHGGALAVIGHVERAWGYSFSWPGAGQQTVVFESTVQRLLDGHPVGSAIEYFNGRYAELSTVLSDELEDIEFGKTVDPYELAGMWTSNNDARGYAIVGDPAVRLPVAGPSEPETERPTITVVTPRSWPAAAEAAPSAAPPAGVGFTQPTGESDSTNGFEQLLRQTEDRFDQRTETREAAEENIDAGRILQADSPERVAKRLARLQIDPSQAYALQAGEISFAPIAAGEGPSADSPVLERILGANDLMGISFLELGQLISRTVGRVHIRNRTGRTLGYGTGFMVSPRLLMTNNHVLDSAQKASHSQIELNYQFGFDGKPSKSVFFALAPSDFFLTDRTLDYTLVAVEPRLVDGRELGAFGWTRLLEEEGKVMVGEYLNIIQHPNGEPKQLALRENRLTDVLDDWLHYHTDTAPGSSGSPVFNDQWEVVALHHSGVPKRDKDRNILTRDGQVWRREMGEHRIDWIANEGGRISRIVRHVKRQRLDTAARRLRAGMFELDPFAGSQPSPPLIGSPSERLAPSGSVQPVIRDDGGVTWTIPLQVTVYVGQPGDGQGVPRVQVGEIPPTVKPTPQPPLEPEPDPELREALEELAAAPDRVYYDEETDAEARTAYYKDIKPSWKSKTMFRRLSQWLRTAHTTQLRYKPRRHVYPWVDLHRDLMLRSIYSGKTFDPEEFIVEDFEITRERALRVNELLTRESVLSAEQLEEEIDLLEAHLPYNCEHVVPQSWFGKQEPMRGDLHHLFACEWGCNSFRGNQAYFDFADFEEVVRDDCGKREENQFEPSFGKGAIARATLYFLLRYPGEINRAGGEFDLERLPILLDWHEQFPVDEYERHRNAAIFAVQGNRNPLIDHPKWASRIDFALGFG